MIREEFLGVFERFINQASSYEASRGPKKYNIYDSFVSITKTLPRLFSQSTPLSNQYLAKGSVGQTNITELPWLAVFDKDITTSAQRGYYIVFLFRTDMEGVYLSLNQGVTQYEERYGVTNARNELKITLHR